MSKVLLGEDGLDRRPHNVAPDCWYYEKSDGLHVYWDGKLVGIIKWRSLRASVARSNTAYTGRKTSLRLGNPKSVKVLRQ